MFVWDKKFVQVSLDLSLKIMLPLLEQFALYPQ